MRPIRRPVWFLLAVYLADCAVLEIRLAHGTGLSTVFVEQYLKTSLKGQKSEFYFQGTVSEVRPFAFSTAGGIALDTSLLVARTPSAALPGGSNPSHPSCQ
jgi:hypothetical protein